MAADMKANGRKMLQMEKAHFSLNQVINTKESSKIIKEMAREPFYMHQAKSMLEIGN